MELSLLPLCLQSRVWVGGVRLEEDGERKRVECVLEKDTHKKTRREGVGGPESY